MKRQKDLKSQNKVLYSERELVKDEHEVTVAALNEQITLKYGLQVQLDRTQEQVDEL